MELHRFGDLNARVVGDGEEQIVVLLHGFGAGGDDLVPLAQVLEAKGTRFIFPEAPTVIDPSYGGRAWWMIDVPRIQRILMTGEVESIKREVPEGSERARQQLDRLLDAVQQKYGVAGSRIVIGGFSQGAMVAADLALRSDRPLAGLIVFSGTIICGDIWKARLPERKGLPIFQSHGRDDSVLPYDFAEELKDMFLGAGFDHAWVPFRGGHEIPAKVIAGAAAFLGRAR
jgi:phospholipase/carboxylesterase